MTLSVLASIGSVDPMVEVMLLKPLAGGPGPLPTDLATTAADRPSLVQAVLWLLLPGMPGKFLVGISLMTAGLVLAGITWLAYPVTVNAADHSTSTGTRVRLTGRDPLYRTVRITRSSAKLLFCLGFVIFMLGPIIYMGWHSQPVWTRGPV